MIARQPELWLVRRLRRLEPERQQYAQAELRRVETVQVIPRRPQPEAWRAKFLLPRAMVIQAIPAEDPIPVTIPAAGALPPAAARRRAAVAEHRMEAAVAVVEVRTAKA